MSEDNTIPEELEAALAEVADELPEIIEITDLDEFADLEARLAQGQVAEIDWCSVGHVPGLPQCEYSGKYVCTHTTKRPGSCHKSLHKEVTS